MFPGRTERIVATIEARMTSSRLPGKVLLPLAGVPALERMVERVRRSRLVDEVAVATTVNRTDDPIVELCRRIGCAVHRGSEEDVLQRVLDTARASRADLIVELTGDCPMIDPGHVDRTIELFFEAPAGACDYAANVVERTFPDGFDVQVFPVKVLEEVDRLTRDPVDRVHVSYFIYSHPERFRLRSWTADGILRWPELRLTLDERADYDLLDRLFAHFVAAGNPGFSALDAVTHLRAHPDWTAVNAHVRTKDVHEG
jgi:spore coat polysaccharide biosynthesis protein SpsF